MAAESWYRRYPSDFITGVRGLSLEEVGAYTLIIEHLYDMGRPIRQTDAWWGACLGCDVRVWKRIRRALVVARKITVDPVDGTISNGRFERLRGASSPEVRPSYGAAKTQLGALLSEMSSENNKTGDTSPRARSREEPEARRKPSLDSQLRKPSADAANAREPTTNSAARLILLAEMIWESVPEPVAAKGDVRQKIAWALRDATAAGEDPERIARALDAYYRSDSASRDGGEWAKPPHRMIDSGDWRTFADPEPLGVPADDAPATVESEGVVYDRPDGGSTHPIGTNELPGPARQLMWLHSWRTGNWTDDWGPRPGSPGCRLWPSVFEPWQAERDRQRAETAELISRRAK